MELGDMKRKWEGLRNSRSRYMDPKYQSHSYVMLYNLIFKYHLLNIVHIVCFMISYLNTIYLT